MIYHIENDLIYRNPAGAVEDGTAICLKLLLSEEESEIESYLVLIRDGEGTKNVKMEACAETKPKGNICFNQAEIKPEKGLYFYYFLIKDIETDKVRYFYKNKVTENPNESAELWQITVFEKGFKTPEFFKGGIMYQIFPDRFYSAGEKVEAREGFYLHTDKNDVPFYAPDENGKVKNEDVYGGNLRGVIEKLDYLVDLGVTVIYLNPIFEANSNHKYNTADYLKIDSMLGDDEIFDELIKKAGEKGIKIILDGVFNHVGDDSIYFNKYGRYNSVGAYQSEKSPYYDWFTFNNFPDDYECWWGVKLLPAIKKDDPLYRAFICGVGGVIEKWLKRGIAGFRIDVADELSDRMLRGIHRVSKELSSENIVIGEVWEDASNKSAYGKRRQYLLGNQLDSVMNYPLKEAIITFLRTRDSSAVADVMDKLINNYPKETLDCLMNILGTHDTMRILTAVGTENFTDSKNIMAIEKLNDNERERGKYLLKAAALMQYTLLGVPSIYYGDEIGMEGYGDPFCRRYFKWDDIDSDLLEFYKKIGTIRRGHKVFTDGIYQKIKEKNGLYFYKREKNDEIIYICVNFSDYDFPVDEKKYQSLLSGKDIDMIPKNSFDLFI